MAGRRRRTQSSSTRNYIGRLHPDGFVDASFNPGANNVVNAVALQADGGSWPGLPFTSRSAAVADSE